MKILLLAMLCGVPAYVQESSQSDLDAKLNEFVKEQESSRNLKLFLLLAGAAVVVIGSITYYRSRKGSRPPVTLKRSSLKGGLEPEPESEAVDVQPSTPLGKRPMSPGIGALLSFVGIVFGTSFLGVFSGANMAAVERGVQGAATFGMIVAILAYFRQRSRLRKWEEQARHIELRENRAARPARRKCRRCGAAIVGTDQPWLAESFCSEQCRKSAPPA